MWLSDFRVVLPDTVLPRASVRIEGGRIAEIVEGPRRDAAMAGGGLLLLPGFIDMHGDMIEREVEPRPGVKMPMELGLRDLDRRLSAAGVTTGYAAVSFHPGGVAGNLRSYDHSVTMLRALYKMRRNLRADHRVHARFEITFPEALNVVEDLIGEGTVDLVSLMDHTPGQGQYRDIERHARFVAKSRGLSDEAALDILKDRMAAKERIAGEIEATLRAMSAVCAAHGIALASHDDDTPEKVSLMRSLGATISEFPVTSAAAAAARSQGLMTVMGAPNALRGQSYSGNLSARDAFADGLLDMLAADYHPSAILPAILALGEQKGDLAAAVRLATQNPARALGLGDRGAIRPGLSADLVVADTGGVGHVRAAFRAGREIYSDGTLFLSSALEEA